MKRMHSYLRIILCLAIIVAVLGTATMSFTDDRVALRTHFFTDSGGLLVRSPSLQFVKDLARNTALTLQYSLDQVTIPPYRGISAKPLPTDGITGASKPVDAANPNANYIKNRNEVVGSLSADRWATTIYYSGENDYVGRLLGVGYNQDFNQKNTNLALSASFGWDTINPLGRDTTFTKRNFIFDATITQSLSPVTSLRFGADISSASGFQSNPYRTVFVNGGYALEAHPQQRLRMAGFVKLNTFIKPAHAAVWLDYRLYGDDWGVRSHTLGLKFYQTMSKRLLLRYRYRFYTQTSAYFYRIDYPLDRLTTYFTADYKLEPFNSHLFGFQAEYQLDRLGAQLPLLDRSTLEIKYERFFTSNNFTANIYQVGLNFSY